MKLLFTARSLDFFLMIENCITHSGYKYGGKHTVMKSGELIYVNGKYHIKKLSIDNKTVTTLLKIALPWTIQFVSLSVTTDDFMVGMFNTDTRAGKIVRYNSEGERILTIPTYCTAILGISRRIRMVISLCLTVLSITVVLLL
jgi:hypothetical protein